MSLYSIDHSRHFRYCDAPTTLGQGGSQSERWVGHFPSVASTEGPLLAASFVSTSAALILTCVMSGLSILGRAGVSRARAQDERLSRERPPTGTRRGCTSQLTHEPAGVLAAACQDAPLVVGKRVASQPLMPDDITFTFV